MSNLKISNLLSSYNCTPEPNKTTKKRGNKVNQTQTVSLSTNPGQPKTVQPFKTPNRSNDQYLIKTFRAPIEHTLYLYFEPTIN